MPLTAENSQKHIYRQRLSLLNKVQKRLEMPMLVFSFIWLVLMIIDFTRGLSPFLNSVSNLIWFLFVFDFLIEFALAPAKLKFLRRSWITLIALALPAFRLFRIFRAARVLRATATVRTLRLARVITSLNRGMSALGKSLSRRGFGYIMWLTLFVLLAGAAGILSFEKEHGPINDYGTAMWWTAMILTTMGTDYFPVTAEGRLLCLLLAVYGFAIFGYVTASVATYFVGRDAADLKGGIAGQKSIAEMTEEISKLRKEIEKLQLK